MKLIEITPSELARIMRGGCGIKRAQAIKLGIPWPLKNGWKAEILGKIIDESTFDLCCDLRAKMNPRASASMAGISSKAKLPRTKKRKAVASQKSPTKPTGVDFIISTDGGCWPNNGSGNGGWACVIRAASFVTERSGGESGTTNNRMELMAIMQGLNATDAGSSVLVRTDSQYSLRACSVWWRGWQARGWMTSTGEPVKNRDLIEEIARLTNCRNVAWEWVRGHNGDPDNERCDELASAMVKRSGADV